MIDKAAIPTKLLWVDLVMTGLDVKKDVIRTDVTMQKTDALVESMSMYFEKTAVGCNLNIAWENTKVSLPIVF